MSPAATLLLWFQLRSPEMAADFEQLMAGDRDIVRSSLDTVSNWRLTRPADVPGQALDQADYVLIAEIHGVDRFEEQASEHIQRLADDLAVDAGHVVPLKLPQPSDRRPVAEGAMSSPVVVALRPSREGRGPLG